MYQFKLLPTVQRGSLSPHPLQLLLFVDLFDDGHPAKCEMIPHFSFDLQNN